MAITCPFPAVIDGSTHLFHDIEFFILGLCATVRPLDAGTISLFDFQTLVVGAGAVWVFGAFTGPKVISRREGALLIILYALYAAKLILDLTGTRI